MKFRVFKSSMDGICAGHETSLAGALAEISYYKGWKSLAELRKAIKRWAKNSVPGSAFTTQGSVVVNCGYLENPPEIAVCPKCSSEHLDWGELGPVENGHFEQVIACDECGEQWQDVFALIERHELCKRK